MKLNIFLLCSLFLNQELVQAQETPDQFPEPGSREENAIMKVTARVIDEDGHPMVDTPIRISIHNVNDYRDMYNDFRGMTDDEGKFSAEGMGRGLAKILVEKKGYYPSSRTVTCYEGTDEQVRASGRFSPWNPIIDLVIRKVVQPIPMRVWSGDADGFHYFPKMDEEFGFDLFEKDWVVPYGKGEEVDLFVKFELHPRDSGNHESLCSIRFANPDDGFMPICHLVSEDSVFQYPREAPSEGYKINQITIKKYAFGFDEKVKDAFKAPAGYLVRFRTIKNKENGLVVSAFYGRVIKPVERVSHVDPFQVAILSRGEKGVTVMRPRFRFGFYLNPRSNDRNLEYDQRNNLAPGSDKNLRMPP